MNRVNPVTRRTFLLRSTASAALVATTGGLVSARGDEVAVGVIGTGNRGQTLLRSFLKIPGVRIVALCDTDKARSEEAVGIAEGHRSGEYTDYQQLLRVPCLDAVVVATPCHLHREHAVAALQAKKHLLLEKPIGITVRDVVDIEEAAKGSSGLVQVGQQLRYDPGRQQMARAVHGGELGTVGFIRASRMGRGYPPAKLWINITEKSGDVMVEQAVHNLDICNWMMNGHPSSAFGSGEQLIFEPSGKTVTDFYSAILKYPGGRYAEFCQNNIGTLQTGGGPDVVYGDEKSLNLGTGEISFRVGRDEQTRSPIPVESRGEATNTTDLAALEFIRCIRRNEKPLCDLEMGRTAALTAMLVRKSIYEKREVTWEQLLREDAPLQRSSS